MSTASPLPLQPLPPSTVSEAETQALKQQVASRLAQHRQRRPRGGEAQPALPLPLSGDVPKTPRRRSVADSVAARFARTTTYRDFLEQEAEAAVRQAEAAAEVARRNAEAIAAVQQQLLDEIDQWNGHAAPNLEAGPADVLQFTATAHDVSPAVTVAVAEPAPVVASHPETPIAAPQSTAAAIVAEAAVALPEPPPEPAIPLPTNLIEFPRQLVAARRARPRLAEGPLRDEADASPERAQLRIFEVEVSDLSMEPAALAGESVLPEWHTIRLDADTVPREAANPDAQTSFALPLHVAPAPQRLMAAVVDGCCVLSGFLLAVIAAAYASPVLPTGIPAAISAAGVLLLFALMYHTLFFSLSDATPGMRYARIGLCTFGDENPTRGSMRRRLLALLLAGMPLGLGFAWALLDEEGLGWHDRISRMYPRAY